MRGKQSSVESRGKAKAACAVTDNLDLTLQAVKASHLDWLPVPHGKAHSLEGLSNPHPVGSTASARPVPQRPAGPQRLRSRIAVLECLQLAIHGGQLKATEKRFFQPKLSSLLVVPAR